MQNKEQGFTLIELMITIAIVGVLAGIAIVAYRNYVETAGQGAVVAHYDQAIDTVRTRFLQYDVQSTLNASGVRPADASEWVTIIDPEGAFAPGGGPAFVVGAGDDDTGAIGIQMNGSWATNDVSITVTRPGYGSFTVDTTTLDQT